MTVCDHVLATHLAHGDLAGNCETFSEQLCDDGNACTVDEFDDGSGTDRCLEVREPTDCDDGNECTADSCDPAGGCVNLARTGASCDDGELCTGLGSCSAGGICQGSPIAGCCTGDADCNPSLCANETCNLSTNECVANPQVCTAPDLCTASACDELTGDCADTPRVCPSGQVCDVADGSCVPIGCPCDYSVVPQTVASWGAEVGFVCPTATDLGRGGVGILGRALVSPLIDVEVSGTPAGPKCGIVQDAVATVLPVSEPEFRVCEAQVIDYAFDLLAIGITLSADAGGVTDPSTCTPVQLP